MAGLTTSKLCRILNDTTGLKTLTVDQLDRLRSVVTAREHLKAVA